MCNVALMRYQQHLDDRRAWAAEYIREQLAREFDALNTKLAAKRDVVVNVKLPRPLQHVVLRADLVLP